MTGQEVVLDLLRYIGVTGFAAVDNDQRLNRPGIDDDDIRRAIGALNSALQVIQKYGPQTLKEGERAAYFGVPTPVAILVIVTNGQSATLSGVVPAWMIGCSILIDGDADMNRISDISGSDISLVRGYRGPGGVVGATVYADCALLGADVKAVVEPVYGSQSVNGIANNQRLLPAVSLDEFTRWQRDQGMAGRQIGIPSRYLVERRRSGEVFLRVTPMPGSSFNATFQAKLLPERVDDTIIDDAGGPDPGYEFTSLSEDDVESVLLPIARWKFFTHPALKNSESRGAVKLEYDEVMVGVRSGVVFEVSVQSHRTHFI
jgi:hypothetical protein